MFARVDARRQPAYSPDVPMISSTSTISRPALGAARAGLQQGLSQVARAAQSIAKGEYNPRNATDLIEGQRTMEVNARVLQRSDEKLGTLLNVSA